MWNDIIILTDNRIYADGLSCFKFSLDLISNMENINKYMLFRFHKNFKTINGIWDQKAWELKVPTLSDVLVVLVSRYSFRNCENYTCSNSRIWNH